MAAENERKAPLASEVVRGKGTLYYLDIRETKEGRPYLCFCTSRRKKGDEKPERNCIFVFSEDIGDFFQATLKLAKASKRLAG